MESIDSSENLEPPALSNADIVRGLAKGNLSHYEQDAAFHVEFFKAPQFFMGDKEGTKPLPEEDHIRIHFPGTKDTEEHCLSDKPEVAQRFAIQHQAWKEGHSIGTPLEQWSPLPKSMVAEFKLKNIYTIEQLANASDAAVQKLPSGSLELRKKAQEEVFEKKNAEVIGSLRNENTELRSQLEILSAQVAQLAANQSGSPKREK